MTYPLLSHLPIICPKCPIYDFAGPMLLTHYKRFCADLTDVTLAVEDNSMPTDDANNRVIPGNVVAPSGDLICKLCKWHHLVAQHETNAGSTNWANFQPMQGNHLVAKIGAKSSKTTRQDL